MNCAEAESLIAEALAGELGEADRAALEEHLAECQSCRQTQVEWQEDDRQLREGFAPWRGASATVAARTIRQLHREQVNSRPATKRKPFAWLPFIVGLSAGFLIALALWRPWAELPMANLPPQAPPNRAPDAPTPQTVLASVIGDVQILPKDTAQWTSVQSGEEVPLGCAIRTQSDGLVEFTCPTGEKARVGTDSQVRINDADEFELVRGQVWAVGCPDRELCVVTDSGTVSTNGGTVNVKQQETGTTVTAATGNAMVRLVSGDESLAQGEELTFSRDKVIHRDRAYSLALITAWMNPLMALKSPDDPELNAHVDALLSHLGASKMSLLSDNELRALGPSCTVPLSRYIRSDEALHDTERRRHAAKLLADLAPISLAGDMVDLLSDDDGEVRAQAAACLKRLTGQDMDCTIDEWRTAPADIRQQAVDQWRTWWQANSFRCQPVPKATAAAEKSTI